MGSRTTIALAFAAVDPDLSRMICEPPASALEELRGMAWAGDDDCFWGGNGDTPNIPLMVSNEPNPTAVKSADITTRGWKPADQAL